MISERQLRNVASIVDEAAAHGVHVLCGGQRMKGVSSIDGQDFSKGYYYPPTVLTDGPKAKIVDTRLWKEEAFGPVIVVIGFDKEEEAVNLANDSEFGLGAALWTTDLSQAFRVSQLIQAGITWGKPRSGITTEIPSANDTKFSEYAPSQRPIKSLGRFWKLWSWERKWDWYVERRCSDRSRELNSYRRLPCVYENEEHHHQLCTDGRKSWDRRLVQRRGW